MAVVLYSCRWRFRCYSNGAPFFIGRRGLVTPAKAGVCKLYLMVFDYDYHME
jgi:hypothetical protein